MRRINAVLILPLLLLASVAGGCARSVEPAAPATLRVAGSTSMRRLLDALSQAYVLESPQVTFDIQTHGSELGLDLVRARQADLSAVSWPPAAAELGQGNDEDRPVRLHAVALDAVCLIVHPGNPLEELSVEDVRGIFRGRTIDWREVHGRVGDILVVSREDGSGVRKAFESLCMDREPVTLAAIVMPGSRQVVEYVARHPNAIGYVGMGDLMTEVKELKLDGVDPRPEAVANGSYPLICPLAIATADPPSQAVQEFLTFVSGPSGQDIVKAIYAPAQR